MSNQVISSWDVYWVMQLDSIGFGLAFLGWMGLIVAAVLSLFNGFSRLDADMYPSLCDKDARAEAWAERGKTRRKVLMASLPLLVASMFVPSSKTAAAMIVLPAIANNQTIQREAGDLYAMAKQALADAAGIKPKAVERRDD